MKKKILFSGALIITAVMIFAFAPKINSSDKNVQVKSEDGIQFIESNWSKALQEAKKQKKLIFLDAYTSWCGPCKMLKRNTFPDKAVGELFNKNFVNVAIDMEKGDGPAVAEKFQVNAYPTLIIADAEGNVVTYVKGYIGPDQLIAFGKHGIKLGKK